MTEVRLSKRAAKDLRKLSASDRATVPEALDELEKTPGSGKLDIKSLARRSPWRRLRVGSHRVLHRPIDEDLLVERVVDRKDLERAAKRLK